MTDNGDALRVPAYGPNMKTNSQSVLPLFVQGKTALKIAFCGGSGTGKTTMAKWLAWFSKSRFIPEVSKDLYAVYGKENLINDYSIYNKFAHEIVATKAKLESLGGQIVCDRTIYDSMVFYEFHLAKERDLSDETILENFNTFNDMMINSMKNEYDIVFFLSNIADHTKIKDGYRNINPVYNRLLSARLFESLESLEDDGRIKNLVEIIPTSMLDRQAIVLKEIEKLKYAECFDKPVEPLPSVSEGLDVKKFEETLTLR